MDPSTPRPPLSSINHTQQPLCSGKEDVETSSHVSIPSLIPLTSKSSFDCFKLALWCQTLLFGAVSDQNHWYWYWFW